MIGDVYKLDIELGEVLYVKELVSISGGENDCATCPLNNYCSGTKATNSSIPRCNLYSRFIEIEEEEYNLFTKDPIECEYCSKENHITSFNSVCNNEIKRTDIIFYCPVCGRKIR